MKAEVLKFHKKLASDCRRDLKTLAPGREREIVEGNLRTAEMWIKFLSDPDVPDFGDPKFKSKMKKLETKDAVKRRANSRRTASGR
jgi:hypothetical protein